MERVETTGCSTCIQNSSGVKAACEFVSTCVERLNDQELLKEHISAHAPIFVSAGILTERDDRIALILTQLSERDDRIAVLEDELKDLQKPVSKRSRNGFFNWEKIGLGSLSRRQRDTQVNKDICTALKLSSVATTTGKRQ
jgi:hypothetical protein